jgi:3D (Asp-Asp-Asp) domain-containing protein
MAVITAYCHCAVCCGRANGLTAASTKPIPYVTIAAPRKIPFGTRIQIRHPTGWRTYIVHDRTARAHDGVFDIFLPSHEAAREFGRQILPIKIIQ